jgi:ribose 5-phosphate isomerase
MHASSFNGDKEKKLKAIPSVIEVGSFTKLANALKFTRSGTITVDVSKNDS